MNIGIFAYGRTGCKIAERFKKLEIQSMTHISEFIAAFDTSSSQLNELSKIDDDWQVLYGQQQFEAAGTGGKLKPAIEAANQTKQNIATAVNSVSRREMDAFVVIGSLGGGTGASGAPVCASVLSENFPHTPIYGVGILPSRHDPDIYKLNAARSVQSFSRETDNVILFDNEQLNVALPEYHPEIDDGTDPDDVFHEVNDDIARCLHTVFSSDEKTGTGKLSGATMTTDEIVHVLSAGGLSSMCYVTETLPRAARPGIRGRFWELIEYFRMTHNERSRKQHADSAHNTGEETQPQTDTYETAQNVTLGTGDDATVQTETGDGELVLNDDTVETTDLPRVPRPGDEAYENDDLSNTREGSELYCDWPHPIKLAPLTLDSNSAMMDFTPGKCMRNLFLLIGPSAHLHSNHAIATADWADEHTAAEYSVAKAYPSKTKKIGVLALCSGIGIPDRVEELQIEAARIAQEAQEIQEKKGKPKQLNVFEGQNTSVPPAF